MLPLTLSAAAVGAGGAALVARGRSGRARKLAYLAVTVVLAAVPYSWASMSGSEFTAFELIPSEVVGLAVVLPWLMFWIFYVDLLGQSYHDLKYSLQRILTAMVMGAALTLRMLVGKSTWQTLGYHDALDSWRDRLIGDSEPSFGETAGNLTATGGSIAYRDIAESSTRVDIVVSIFLGDGQNADTVERSLSKLLYESGLEPYGHEPPIIGSWYRKLRARISKETGHLNTDQVVAEAERKLRIELFDKAQAMIDNQQSTGAAALIASLQGESRACIRVGSLLVLKIDGLVLVNNLTQYQLAWLERNQTLLRDPEGLLRSLEELGTSRSEPVAEALHIAESPLPQTRKASD